MGSILLVESDPVTADQWAAALAGANHAVQLTAMGEALSLICDGGIDVVIIDAADPRTGVQELARSIEALPDAPPLILVSSSPHAPEISARIGVAAFLAKPCETGELVSCVNRLFGPLPPMQGFEDEPTTTSRYSG